MTEKKIIFYTSMHIIDKSYAFAVNGVIIANQYQ